jgi:hypothetical protein
MSVEVCFEFQWQYLCLAACPAVATVVTVTHTHCTAAHIHEKVGNSQAWTDGAENSASHSPAGEVEGYVAYICTESAAGQHCE